MRCVIKGLHRNCHAISNISINVKLIHVCIVCLILLTLYACCDYCHLLTMFANNLDPDQAWKNVGPDLDPGCLPLMIFLKEFKKKIEKKIQQTTKCMKNYPACIELISCHSLYIGLFVWFDSLRPINNLLVKQGRVFLGWTSTKPG